MSRMSCRAIALFGVLLTIPIRRVLETYLEVLAPTFAGRPAGETRTVGVTHHHALWSPDFPLPGPHAASRAATVCPACSPEDRSAAPTPVSTPHPTSAARSSGSSGSIFTIEFSWSSMRSA